MKGTFPFQASRMFRDLRQTASKCHDGEVKIFINSLGMGNHDDSLLPQEPFEAFIDLSAVYLTSRPGLAPAGDLLSLASPRESKQREGEPQSGPLRGSLRCSCQVGSGSNSASPQTIARPFPPAPALLSPARTAGEKNRERGAERALRVLRSWYFSRLPRPGWAEQRRRGRIKISDVRRLRSRQVSEISAPFEQRKVPVAKRRDPDCGSPFFSLGFFGEAKKSNSPAGARPGLLVKGNPAKSDMTLAQAEGRSSRSHETSAA